MALVLQDRQAPTETDPMDASGLSQVFAVLRAHAMALPDHERYAYLAALAVEEAAMHEARATGDDRDLWSPSRPKRAEAPKQKVWDLTAALPRRTVVVGSIPAPRRHAPRHAFGGSI